ncbi:MAG: deoxyguanosinetriphosphate triphosphohydrolase, partial [Acidimicrobiales bacterium]
MGTTDRAAIWASTMAGHEGQDGVRVAHADSGATLGRVGPLERAEREAVEGEALAPGATAAEGAGRRAVAEEPDAWRTCFERDRDRILHS